MPSPLMLSASRPPAAFAGLAPWLRPAAVLTVMAGLAPGSLGQVADAGTHQQTTEDQPGRDAGTRAGGHPISGILFEFVRDHPRNPSPDNLLESHIEVTDTPEGLAPAREGEESREIWLSDIAALRDLRFSDQGLALLAPAVVSRLKDLGYVGVYVIPDPAQFRVVDGRVVDLRAPGVTTVTLQVTLSLVTELRTVALGERVETDKTLNHPVHESIKRRSPIQPFAPGDKDRRDLLVRPTLDDYIFRLNRHPGRRADVAVSAAGDAPGAVTLDYLITENRPWLLFAQLSNTGSENTSRLREHFGFIHNQLTNNDDILSLTYQTANFDKVHALTGSYERPLFSDRLRGRVFGSWYKYVASDVGQADADFDGDGWNAGGELAWNFFQRSETFVDLVLGARFEHIAVDNELAQIEGSDDFFLPSIGLRLERSTEIASTNGYLGVEWNIPSVAGTDEATIDRLGRFDADDSWTALKGSLTHSFYLEPLFSDDPASVRALANEVLLSVNGQHALGSRLVPNYEQTAGGLYSVRGYPESTVAGDNVIQGTIEYRYHIARGLAPRDEPGELFGRPFRWRPQYRLGPTDWDLALKGFFDWARVENSDKQSFEADSTLLGAGIGADLSLTRRFSIRLDWGFALRDIRDGAGVTTVKSGHNELQFVLTLIY